MVVFWAVQYGVEIKTIRRISKVSTPKEVRYGWKNWMVGTLFNKEGLSASSFSSTP